MGVARTVVAVAGIALVLGGCGSGDPSATPPTFRPSPGQFSSISAGGVHSCAIDTDGQAWCWGRNLYGTLGDQNANTTPIEVAGAHVLTAIVGGDRHSCALDGDGRAWCWGADDSGQLGDGAGPGRDKNTPVEVAGSHRFATITAGRNHTCALDSEGQAWCWGADDSGQLGEGGARPKPTSKPAPVYGNHTFSTISANSAQTCALATDGTAWCWGGGLSWPAGQPSRRPEKVRGSTSLKSIAVGDRHACALDGDGRAWCWGSNRSGQLGVGDASLSDSVGATAVAGDQTFTSIVANSELSCALDKSGTAWCWGSHWGYDEDDMGSYSEVEEPSVPTKLENGHHFTELTAGSMGTCGLDPAGRVWCWDSYRDRALAWGAVDDGDYSDDQEDSGGQEAYSDRITPIEVARGHTFASVASGGYLCATDNAGQAWCWGSDQAGGFDGLTVRPVAGRHTFTAISAENSRSCALDTSGRAWCWGWEQSGVQSHTPVEVAGGRTFTAISVGWNSTCALDDQSKAWCWDSSAMPAYQPILAAGGRTLSKVDAGDDPCALDQDGKPWCWPFWDPSEPIAISGERPYIAIETGTSHACALDEDGKAWCWGDNNLGQLGNGVPVVDGAGGGEGIFATVPPEPVPVSGGHEFTGISVGGSRACALDASGQAWCWGGGYLGDGRSTTRTASSQPVAVSGRHTFALISVGAGHTCAVDTNGMAWCWGENGDGQLGNADLGGTNRDTPVAVIRSGS